MQYIKTCKMINTNYQAGTASTKLSKILCSFWSTCCQSICCREIQILHHCVWNLTFQTHQAISATYMHINYKQTYDDQVATSRRMSMLIDSPWLTAGPNISYTFLYTSTIHRPSIHVWNTPLMTVSNSSSPMDVLGLTKTNTSNIPTHDLRSVKPLWGWSHKSR